MRVMLINPNILIHKGFPLKEAAVPLGLGYLASVITNKGHNVKIVDSILEGFNQCKTFNTAFNEYGLSDEQIVEKIKNYKPEVIGISCSFTSKWLLVKRLSQKIKEAYPDGLIIIGGIHSTNSPESVLNESCVDFVVIGEGESVIEQFLDKLITDKDYSKIKGLGYKENNILHINKNIEFIQDLDKIPFPARHLMAYEKYFEYNRNSVIATRGCPFNCSFCSMTAVMGRQFRHRSVNNFVDELEEIYKTYKTRFFSFDDDNFTLNREFVIGVCDEIIKRKLKICWHTPNGVYINSLTFDVLKKMKEAGCYFICLAIESGDERMHKYMNKSISLSQVKKVIDWCTELKIFTLGFFMVGMLGETMQSMEISKKFALSLPLDSATVAIATPYPNTRFYKECIQKQYIKNYMYDLLNGHECVVDTENLTAEQVKSFQVQFLKEIDDARKPPFTHPLLKKNMRYPESAEALESFIDEYFKHKPMPV